MSNEQLIAKFNEEVSCLVSSWSKLTKARNKTEKTFTCSGYKLNMYRKGYRDFYEAVQASLDADAKALENGQPVLTSGFLRLCERGHADSTVEGFVVCNIEEYGVLFSAKQLDAARVYHSHGLMLLR